MLEATRLMGKKKAKTAFEMAYAASLGIAMVIAIFGSLLIGVYLDRKLGTKNIFTPIFLIVGIGAGFRNFYVFIKRFFPEETRRRSTRKKEDEGSKEKPPAEKD